MTCTEYLGAINLTLGWLSNKRKFYHAVKQSLFYSMVKFPFIGECYNIRRPTSRWRLRHISWYIQGLCSQLSQSWHLGKGGGGGRACSNNPDHKVGMLAQRILKMPSSIFLGLLELQSEHPYILNECQLHGWHEKGVLSFVSGGKLCPHPHFPCARRDIPCAG